MSKLPIAVQMYTVRAAAARDFRGALRQVARIGYPAVELAGTFGLSIAELQQILADLGLKVVSAHVSLADLRANLDRQIETYLALGAEYLVCPSLPQDERSDEARYRAAAAELNDIGRRCRAKGLLFCYHHHAFEFVQFNGKTGLEILWGNSDPAHVQLETDTYWAQAGGLDPAQILRRWAGRVPLVHVKDMSAGTPPTFAEVGAGVLDWPGIFAAAKESGAKWYIVEQDTCPGDPLASLQVSFDNLVQMTNDGG
ncbi:MAG: sugar phosphate isomerase/epimerase [Anaerolineae bacterium]|nr:sugar phosphate isomerase/epimerase [Anaerolineae bacterium]